MSWMSSNKSSKIILLLFLVLVGLCLLLPIVALAEGDIQLKIRPGLGGEYKPMGWVPVSVEVSNQGANLEGDIFVELKDHYNYSGTYYQPLSVATGATKQVTLLVPGEGLSPSTEVKVVSQGQEVAKQKIGGRSLGQDTLFVGVLASDPDTANFLATLPKNKFPMPVRVTPLKAEDIPSLGTALQSLSVLIVNNFSVEELHKDQLAAITEWTQQGGLLVLAGGAHFEKLGTLAGLAPVTVEGNTQVNSIDELAQLAGGNTTPLSLDRPFTVSKASQVQGKVLSKVEESPLLVADKLDNGNILYVAFDLAEKPLSTWSGNSSLWAQLLMQVNGNRQFTSQVGILDEIWPLSSAADQIPALQLPRISMLAIVFGLYVFFVGPVLYFIFKRVGRREWLWFVVPILATLFAVGIYLYGSFERTNQVLAHNISFVELSANGETDKIKGSSAVFVPRGGDYTLRLQERGLILPQDQGYSYNNQQAKQTWVSLNEEEAQVTFKDVEFWSMRKVAVEQASVELGEIAADLTYAEGKLVGTVTNQTNLTLRDVRVYHGRHLQQFESMQPGETLTVDLAFDASIQPGSAMNAQRLLPGSGTTPNLAEYRREERMLELLNYGYYGRYQPVQRTTPVSLIGWTEDQLYGVDIVGERKKDYNLALVKAELAVQPADDGYVFYPAGTFEPTMTESNIQVDYYHREGYYVPAGELTFEFHFNPQFEDIQKKLEIEQIQLYTWSEDGTPFDKQVYNWQTGSYEDYEQVFEKHKLTKEKMGTYLSSDGILRLNMQHHQAGHRHLGQPAVSVEGKVLE